MPTSDISCKHNLLAVRPRYAKEPLVHAAGWLQSQESAIAKMFCIYLYINTTPKMMIMLQARS